MPFRFARRVRNLEIKYCPTKKKDLSGLHGSRSFSSLSSSSSGSSQQICPSCVLPIVVAFIFGFTVVQLFVIHRTIVAYKTRSLAFEEVYGPSHNDTKSKDDLLAFSKKFDAAWQSKSHQKSLPSSSSSASSFSSGSSGGVEWIPSQSYPLRILRKGNINHIWGEVKCPEVPAKLHGNISINVKKEVSLEELTRHNSEVLPGGRWQPTECSPRFHVALIIPYRFRWSHLKLLLSVLHPMLRRQQLSYQIFVAEQYGNYTFNKGLLMNAAFLLALNSSDYAFDCVIFHDVDLLPETDRNIYNCANSPRHLSVSIDAYGYRLPYSKLVGGVFAVSVDHFIQVNGYSNLYWGWGAEDDDMYKRLIANQLPINRPLPDLAKYKMLQHGRRQPNQFINPLIRTARLRFPQDGLTTCHFRLVASTAQALFTHFLVDVGQPSYSVLEPNVHLEEMIPPSVSASSSSSSHWNWRNPSPSSSPNYNSHHSRNRNHNRKQQKRSVEEPISKELFILRGIARDNDNQGKQEPVVRTMTMRLHKNDGPSPLAENEARSHNPPPPQPHLSSSGDKEVGEDIGSGGNGDGKIGMTGQMLLSKIRSSSGSGSGNNDIPLDPDVPVEQEDEDDEDDDDEE